MPWDKTATDPLRWATKMKDAPREAINIFAFSVFNRVVMRTPVDTGAARQNWLVTINSETTECEQTKGKGGRVISDGAKVIESAKGDDKIYIQNNLPYIRMLEYGGYGKAKGQGKSLIGRKFPGRNANQNGDSPPVEKQKTEKQSKITAEGFSLQAPHGMVGLVLSKANELWEKAVQVAKGIK